MIYATSDQVSAMTLATDRRAGIWQDVFRSAAMLSFTKSRPTFVAQVIGSPG
jgi:ABC-type sugar transport system ATPase subunit